MNFVDRKNRAFNCFANFNPECDDKEYHELKDIFLPMLFKENNCRLEINVGKRVSDEKFVSWLSLVTHSFIVIPSDYDNEPQLIIRDCTNISKKNITLINLTAMSDLHIETEEAVDFYSHRICFNYNKEVDYQMHIIVNKE